MKTISDYLDDAKRITGSDYETAKRLGVRRQAISKQRARNTLSNELCVSLAEILGVDPMKIIAASSAQKNPIFWQRWVAAICILTVAGFAFESVYVGSDEIYQFAALYIMRNFEWLLLMCTGVHVWLQIWSGVSEEGFSYG